MGLPEGRALRRGIGAAPRSSQGTALHPRKGLPFEGPYFTRVQVWLLHRTARTQPETSRLDASLRRIEPE